MLAPSLRAGAGPEPPKPGAGRKEMLPAWHSLLLSLLAGPLGLLSHFTTRAAVTAARRFHATQPGGAPAAHPAPPEEGVGLAAGQGGGDGDLVSVGDATAVPGAAKRVPVGR